MTSEPQARTRLYHSLSDQMFNRAQFDLYLDTYNSLRDAAATEWRPANEDQTDAVRVSRLSVSSALADSASNPELAAFAALMAADYDRAKEIVEAMSAPDRAVLEFWATELSQLVSHVQITEDRF
jgi:hypothetical protein